MDEKQKTDAVLIKEYFDMSASQAIAALKTLAPEDKKQLADGIRDGSFTY